MRDLWVLKGSSRTSTPFLSRPASGEALPVALTQVRPLMRNDYDSSWLPRPFLFLKWVILAVGVAGLWLAFNYDRLEDYFEARARRNDVKRTVETMDRQYTQLLQEKQELEKWGFSAERAIRERLKMIRPGERVLIVEPLENESDFSERPSFLAAPLP